MQLALIFEWLNDDYVYELHDCIEMCATIQRITARAKSVFNRALTFSLTGQGPHSTFSLHSESNHSLILIEQNINIHISNAASQLIQCISFSLKLAE